MEITLPIVLLIIILVVIIGWTLIRLVVSGKLKKVSIKKDGIEVEGPDSLATATTDPPPLPPTIPTPTTTVQSLHQVPGPAADFTGREKELAELEEKVKEDGVSISGIRGMGGIGKTQLALKLAEQLKPQYPDA